MSHNDPSGFVRSSSGTFVKADSTSTSSGESSKEARFAEAQSIIARGQPITSGVANYEAFYKGTLIRSGISEAEAQRIVERNRQFTRPENIEAVRSYSRTKPEAAQRFIDLGRESRVTQTTSRQFGSFSGRVEEIRQGRPVETRFFVEGQEVARTKAGEKTFEPKGAVADGGRARIVFDRNGTRQEVEIDREQLVEREFQFRQRSAIDLVLGGGTQDNPANSNLTVTEQANLQSAQDQANLEFQINPSARRSLSFRERVGLAYRSAGETPGGEPNIRGIIRAGFVPIEIISEKITPKKFQESPLNVPVSSRIVEDVAIFSAFNPAIPSTTSTLSRLQANIPRDVVSVTLQKAGKVKGRVTTVTGFETTGQFAGETSGIIKSVSTKSGGLITTTSRGTTQTARGLGKGTITDYFKATQTSQAVKTTGRNIIAEQGGVQAYKEIPIELIAGRGAVYRQGGGVRIKNVVDVSPPVRDVTRIKDLQGFYSKSFALGGRTKFVLGATKTAGKEPSGYAGLVFKYVPPKDMTKFTIGKTGVKSSKQFLENLYKQSFADTIGQASKIVQKTTPKPSSRSLIVSASALPTQTYSYPTSQYAGLGLYERTEGGQIPMQVPTIKIDTSYKPILTPTNIFKTDQGSRGRTRQRQVPIEIQAEETPQRFRQVPLIKTKPDQAQRFRQVALLKTTQKQKAQQRQSIRFNFPKPQIPKDPFFSFKMKPQKESKGLLGGFIVEVRRFGVFRPVGIGRTPYEAIGIGRNIVERTLAATFKVKGFKGTNVPGFRTKKEDGGFVFIEPRKRRLSTRSEVAEIQGYLKQSLKGGRR